MTQTDDPATPAREETLPYTDAELAELRALPWMRFSFVEARLLATIDLLAASVPPRPDDDDALREAAKFVSDYYDRWNRGDEEEWWPAIDRLRAALATPAATVREAGLAEAWADAEAVLPGGWWLEVGRDGGGCWTKAGPPLRYGYVQSGGETPEAALRALTAKLKET